ncbi:hypothetical protein [Brevundimonas sp.]|uniref:hypothetical protein n=1 Tax=Brevundimonas sp. TaxID=1871086 RepID=UPI002ABCB80E|nr:hypothetical protein [Brevundimonas sp.]MDZ4365086.1 hypothetical protein [Brevundimonas sp.]
MVGITPDLKAIDATADFNVQLYAIIGAATSLAVETEAEMFNVYVSASGLEHEDAAAIFYRFVKFSHKRDTMEKAVKAALQRHAIDNDWPGLLAEVNSLGGDGAARNLISHNKPVSQITVTLDKERDAADVFIRNYIDQNQYLVAAERRKPQQEDYGTLYRYCEWSVVCANRLRHFARQLRIARET